MKQVLQISFKHNLFKIYRSFLKIQGFTEEKKPKKSNKISIILFQPFKSLALISHLILISLSPLAVAHSSDLSFVELAKKFEPSVVNISVTKKSANNRFFLAPGIYVPYNPPPISGSGSGFVIDSKGLIVTNTHVITGADEIKIQFAGSQKFYKAQLVGKDELSDIALIKIKPKHPLKPVKLGNSKDIQVGEKVAAFGNPHGYGHSMTQGIISAIKREIDELNLFPLLQTDASINPGNSGGPLVNLKGEVVGVNNAIAAGAQGISFAIPIDNVKNILNDLKNHGYVKRGFIGVLLGSAKGGSLIMDVVPGGPADRAGLQAYDLIVKFGKTTIKNSKDLANAVAKTPLSKKVPVKIIRNGKEKRLFVTIQLRNKNSFNFPKTFSKKNKKKGVKTVLGLNLIDPNPSVFKQLNLPDLGARHPMVLSVDASSPAGKAHFRPGDLIFKVNEQNISKVSDFKKYIKRSGGNTLNILRYHHLYGQYLAFVISLP